MSSIGIEQLLGSTLLRGTEKIPTTTALSGTRAVGLYFSAHWCPPCRGFTPRLAKQYEEHFKAKGLEIVFVSSDRDQEAFDEYFGSQPWLALPFSERDLKEKLGAQFKVRGIPTLVIIDPETGDLINADGREAVSKDPTGDRLPWHPPSKEEKARTVLDAIGPDLISAAAGKPIGLYFSAHWCPPCRGFTPELAKLYNDGLKDNLEIVFVSSDRDQAAFDDYFKTMPWKALPFERRDAKDTLSEACGVEGIPTLAVIHSATGEMITAEGRAMVQTDPRGATIAEGGWLPQPFNDVNHAPDALNEKRCVVALGTEETMAGAVRELAAEYYESAGKDIDKMQYAFFHAPPGGITAQLRKLTQMTGDANALVLLDIPDGGSFYALEESEGTSGAATAGEIKAFMRDVEDGKVTKRKFSRN